MLPMVADSHSYGTRERETAFVHAGSIDHTGIAASRADKTGSFQVWISLSEVFSSNRQPFRAAFQATNGCKVFVSALLYTQTTSTRL